MIIADAPPRIRRRLVRAAASLVAGMLAVTAPIMAQQRDTLTAPRRIDSLRAQPARPPRLATRLNPPITTKQAFLYSLALPGLGQSKLDRGVSSALFSGVELGAIAMLRHARADLREARRYLGDSLPISFTASGASRTATGLGPNGYTGELVKTRKLHVEDWLATLMFNHLIAGADAFVSAQLWDVPVTVSVLPGPERTFLVASIRW